MMAQSGIETEKMLLRFIQQKWEFQRWESIGDYVEGVKDALLCGNHALITDDQLEDLQLLGSVARYREQHG